MKAKKRKRPWRWLRYRKNDPAHNLLVAAQRWIHANGGTAVLIGGVGILDQANPFIPGTQGKYQVCVGVLGKIPELPKKR
jgi:hypothetical protein